MIKISITSGEKYRLIHFAEDSKEKGHWGNAAIEIPEGKALEEKIINAGTELELTYPQVELLFTWLSNVTDHGFILLPEDSSLIQKVIYKLIKYYDEKKNLYLSDLNKIYGTIESYIKTVPEKILDLPINHFKEMDELEKDKVFKELYKKITNEDYQEKEEGTPSEVKAEKNNDEISIKYISRELKKTAEEDEGVKNENNEARELIEKTKDLAKKINKKK